MKLCHGAKKVTKSPKKSKYALETIPGPSGVSQKVKGKSSKIVIFGVDFEILDILDLWVFVIPVGGAEYSTGLKKFKIQKFISS